MFGITAFSAAPFSALEPLNPNVAKELLGVAASGSLGSFPNPAGVLATGSVGTLVRDTSVVLSGVFAGGLVGTLRSNIQVPFTGNLATGSVGTISVDGTVVGLSGVFATGYAGRAAADLSNVLATGSVGSLTRDILVALTGATSAGNTGTLTLDTRSIGVTGVLAQGNLGRIIAPLLYVYAQGNIGTVVQGISIALTGVTNSGTVGNLGVAERLIGLQGTTAIGVAGNIVPVYWRIIDDSQTPPDPNWILVDTPATDPLWVLINTPT